MKATNKNQLAKTIIKNLEVNDVIVFSGREFYELSKDEAKKDNVHDDIVWDVVASASNFTCQIAADGKGRIYPQLKLRRIDVVPELNDIIQELYRIAEI